MKKWNGSMYALDIACIRWQSFKVYSPNIKNIYVVEHIWYDNRLGNYIIIRHWNLKWLYWHTVSELQVWDKINPWQIIWEVNRSWISENYHLHIELWLWDDNISFEYTKGKWIKYNSKSFDLLFQRWLVKPSVINSIILDHLTHWEWLRLEAYPDWFINWVQRYSIGMWNKSYKWETITKDEAIKRARVSIQSIRERYWLDKYPLNVQIAVVLFVHNIWSLDTDQVWLLQNKYYKALWNNFILYNKITNKDWEKVESNWLSKRRNYERDLLFNVN